MDTNGLVFIGFIFFEAIKQILYCFLTLHSRNFKTMSFWKHKNKLDLKPYLLPVSPRKVWLCTIFIYRFGEMGIHYNLVPNFVWTTQNYQIQSRISSVRGSSSNSLIQPFCFYCFIFHILQPFKISNGIVVLCD